jgi:2-polyprenyl-3-methyl-5-hydroxy-6-metoxy-1,4-benzoquinol methylase
MSENPQPSTIREEDIRPAALMVDKQKCVDWDRAFLLARRDQWVPVHCPSCDANDHQPFGEKAGFVYVECRCCGTVYTNPRPSQELSHAFYTQSQNYEYWNRHIFPATETTRRASIFRPRAQRVVDYCRQYGIATGTLFEVGAAFGTFCEEIKTHGLFQRVIAVEPTPDLAATCRKRGLETIEKPIELISESAIADVVAAFEVLEHLFHPRGFITQCGRLLRPGGLLVLTCPNVRGFDVATLRMRSNTFDHEHVNYFHPAALSQLVSRCGFAVLDVQTPGKLDADLVRKQALAGPLDLTGQPFLRQVLVDDWERLGGPFQDFLAAHRLSSHMWLIARKSQAA